MGASLAPPDPRVAAAAAVRAPIVARPLLRTAAIGGRPPPPAPPHDPPFSDPLVLSDALARHPLLRLDEVTSTNDVARRGVVDGHLGHGAVVLAQRQTAGRGRRGRAWVTVPRRGLAMSLVVQTPPLARLSRVTVLAAVAMCRALEQLGAPPLRIKWPNDLMRDDRKLGGLLCEPVVDRLGRGHLVLGLGVNLALRAGDLPPELAATATDAGLAWTPELPEHTLAAFLVEWDAALEDLGTPADVLRGAEYARRSWLDGRQVRVRDAGTPRAGRVVSITPDGDLVLATADGEHRLVGETTELLDASAAAR